MGKNKIGAIVKSKINALAKMFYSMQGYTVEDGTTFLLQILHRNKGVGNSEGIHPLRWGVMCGELLEKIRDIDTYRYDKEVKNDLS